MYFDLFSFIEVPLVGVYQKASKRKLFGQPGDQALGNKALPIILIMVITSIFFITLFHCSSVK